LDLLQKRAPLLELTSQSELTTSLSIYLPLYTQANMLMHLLRT
jgi:hypothetical protein